MGPWLHVMEAAFVVFVLALLALVWRGARADGTWKRGAWKWGAVAAVAFVVWAWTLARIPRP